MFLKKNKKELEFVVESFREWTCTSSSSKGLSNIISISIVAKDMTKTDRHGGDLPLRQHMAIPMATTIMKNSTGAFVIHPIIRHAVIML